MPLQGIIIKNCSFRVAAMATALHSQPIFVAMSRLSLFALAFAAAVAACTASPSWIPPFYRVLKVTNPPMTGADVNVTQHLVVRDAAVGAGALTMSGVYDFNTMDAVQSFQTGRLWAYERQCAGRVPHSVHLASPRLDCGRPSWHGNVGAAVEAAHCRRLCG